MKWDEFINNNMTDDFDGQRLTNVECPECGKKVYLNTKIVLTSYPAKYSYWCSCGWGRFFPCQMESCYGDST